MGRMEGAAAQVAIEMALLPLAGDTGNDWSIDNEPMGPGWHDSSWMLRKGLDVIEGLPTEDVPPEWRWRWWAGSGSAPVSLGAR